MFACTFFGHSDTGVEIVPLLRKTLIDLIENKNVCTFYVGNHGQYDYMVKQVLRELAKTYPIRYAVVLAYLPNKKREPERDSATETILPEGIEIVPLRFAISYRNKWMVENSDYVITYVKHVIGGAAQFKEYASKKRKNVINLAEY